MLSCTDNTKVEHAEMSDMQARLNLYLDGELADTSEPSLFAHLSVCEGCRDQFNAVMRFRRLMQDERFEVPAWTDDQLFRRIESLPIRNGPHTSDRMGYGLGRVSMSVRAAVVLLVAVASVAAAVAIGVDNTPTGRVVGLQEKVSFEQTVVEADPVYVFYPGLIIEESR